MVLNYLFKILISLMVSISGSVLAAIKTDNEFRVLLEKEDVCWQTSNLACDVVGVKVELKLDHEYLYSIYSLGRYESEDVSSDQNNERLEFFTFRLGVGKDIILKNNVLGEAIGKVELSLMIQNDVETNYDQENNRLYTNKNYNDGFELRFGIEQEILDRVSAGIDVAFQKYQNCSHPSCHGQLDSKPVMGNKLIELFASTHLSRDKLVGYRYVEMLEEPDRYYNGRSPDAKAHKIELTFLF